MATLAAPVVVLVLALAGVLGVAAPAAAATSLTWVAQDPTAPREGQSVRVWANADTALGESVGLEYQVNGSYTKVLGTYDDATTTGADWYADIPSQASGTQVSYQLFVRNQSGSDYDFTGFDWNYTVGQAGNINWDALKHDTFSSYYRSPFGAVKTGTPVTLRFRTLPLNVDSVDLVVYTYDPSTDKTSAASSTPMTYLEDRTENGTKYAIWTLTLTTPSTPAILYYKFKATAGTSVAWYSDDYADAHDNLKQGGTGAASSSEPNDSFQLTVYDKGFTTPTWLHSARIYQIFPDRFRNGDTSNDYCTSGNTDGCPAFYGGTQTPIAHTTWNSAIGDPYSSGQWSNQFGTQFYGGDLDGITQELGYIQKAGFDTLYLTPIFMASSNHRYDTDNYLQVDPALGGNAAFERLVTALEKRGMHLILDGVFNHTSSDSIYFNRYGGQSTVGACQSLTSAWRSWYTWNDNTVPCGSADYVSWAGYDSLPKLNHDSADVRNFIYRNSDSVIATWYDAGASGWRFDVADEMSHAWWRDFRSYAKADNANGPLIGEVWYDASQYLLGDQLDSVMNYRFRKNVLGFARGAGMNWTDNDNNGSNTLIGLTPSQFDASMTSIREDYPEAATDAMMNLIDSHDTNRALYVLTELGDNGLTQAKQRLRLSSLFQYTYMGAPTVYYGDEVAINSPSLHNGSNGPEDDPYNRAPYPWADQAGDTSTYGPADQTMLAWYSKLSAIRQAHPALTDGSFTTLLTGDTTASTTDDQTYAFARTQGSDEVVVAMDNGSSDDQAAIPAPSAWADGTVVSDLVSGHSYTVANGSISVSLTALSGAILVVDHTAPTVTLSAAPAANAAGWNTGTVTVTATASDDNGVESVAASIDKATAATTDGTTATASVTGDGVHTVQATATDWAGNTSASAATTVRIDTTAPTTTATTGGGTIGQATVTLTATDAGSGVATTSYSLDGGSTQAYAGPITLTTAGVHTVRYWSSDVAGNVETAHNVTVTDNAAITLSGCLSGKASARFGYTSANSVPVTVAAGTANKVSPGAVSQGQPTTFAPGTTAAAFTTAISGSSTTWSLTGPDGVTRTATVTKKTAACR